MKKNEIIQFIKDYGILLLIIIGPIIGFIAIIFLRDEASTSMKQVHWHIPISYNLCGDTTQLKDNGEHGSIHGHNDKKIHLEGIIDTENRSETLGGFFKAAGIKFDKSQIGSYRAGDVCKGSDDPGKVSVLVNGKENSDFENYIMNDKDDIKIIFK